MLIHNNHPKLAMISTMIRRDLQDPVRHFNRILVMNYYQKKCDDIAGADLSNTDRYQHPLDLYRKLKICKPDVLQGVEPFSITSIPYILAGWLYSKQHQIPLIVVSLENRPLREKYGKVASKLLRNYLKPYFLHADLIIYLNQGTYQNLLFCDAPASKMIHLMYGTWGVDTREFSPSGPIRRGNAASKIILFIGRVVEEKGIFDLAAAFTMLQNITPKTRLVIVGEGRDLLKLKSMFRSLRTADKVNFVGQVRNNKISSYLRCADLVVTPSITSRRWEEQVGMVNLQAMACGVPIVSTLSGAIPEYVENGFSGVLVPEKQPRLLAEAIMHVLEDDELSEYLSANGRFTALKKYDARKNIKAVEEEILALV
jgi:glycosyltransferase involved in cell wall biosynthesis